MKKRQPPKEVRINSYCIMGVRGGYSKPRILNFECSGALMERFRKRIIRRYSTNENRIVVAITYEDITNRLDYGK